MKRRASRPRSGGAGSKSIHPFRKGKGAWHPAHAQTVGPIVRGPPQRGHARLADRSSDSVMTSMVPRLGTDATGSAHALSNPCSCRLTLPSCAARAPAQNLSCGWAAAALGPAGGAIDRSPAKRGGGAGEFVRQESRVLPVDTELATPGPRHDTQAACVMSADVAEVRGNTRAVDSRQGCTFVGAFRWKSTLRRETLARRLPVRIISRLSTNCTSILIELPRYLRNVARTSCRTSSE